MRVIVVNAKGGQAEGPPLARWALWHRPGFRTLARWLRLTKARPLATHLRRRKPLLRPLVLLISECDGPNGANDRIAKALLAKMPHGQLYRGTADHGAREVAVMVLGRAVKVHAWDSTRLTEGSGWSGGGQDRWATVVRCTYRARRLAFVSTHASTTQPDSISPALGKVVTALRAEGYAVVVGGDLNQPDGPHSSWRTWAQRTGFAHYVTRVMWALVDGGLRVGRTRALPLKASISDHPTALSVSLRIKRGQKK